jgi:hypothetical protein
VANRLVSVCSLRRRRCAFFSGRRQRFLEFGTRRTCPKMFIVTRVFLDEVAKRPALPPQDPRRAGCFAFGRDEAWASSLVSLSRLIKSRRPNDGQKTRCRRAGLRFPGEDVRPTRNRPAQRTPRALQTARLPSVAFRKGPRQPRTIQLQKPSSENLHYLFRFESGWISTERHPWN